MKFLFVLFSLAISLQLFAAPVPQADLDKINAFILKLQEAEGSLEDGFVEITAADKNDSGEVTALEAELTMEDLGSALFALEVDGDQIDFQVVVEGDLKGEITKGEVEQLILMIASFATEIATEVNEEGSYTAEFEYTNNSTEATAVVLIEPVNQDDPLESVLGEVNYNKETMVITGSVEAVLNSGDEMVQEGSAILTEIFDTLLNEQEPTEEQMDKWGDFFEKVIEPLL